MAMLLYPFGSGLLCKTLCSVVLPRPGQMEAKDWYCMASHSLWSSPAVVLGRGSGLCLPPRTYAFVSDWSEHASLAWMAIRRCRRCWNGCIAYLWPGNMCCSSALVNTARFGNGHGVLGGKSRDLS